MRRRRGAVAVLIAVMLPVLLAAAGLGVDAGTWQREEIRLQLATDAAAMGAGRLLAGQSASMAQFQAAAMLEADAVSAQRWVGTLNPTPTVSVAANWTTVTVTLTSQANSYFSPLIGFTAPTLSASATSGLSVTSAACVLALNTSASPAIAVNNMGSITRPAAASLLIRTRAGDLPEQRHVIASSIGAVGTVQPSPTAAATR